MINVGKVVSPCTICASQDTVFVADHADFLETGIWFCSSCDHWFSYPEPDESELRQHYKEIYGPRRKRYFGEEYDALMRRRAQGQVRFIEDGLSRAGILDNIYGWRIIDWGCGVGALVGLLQEKGADVVGYDSDQEAIEVGRKQWSANIADSSMCDVDVLQGQFDLLLLSHVIEHLPGIRRTLKNLLKFLRTGGFVFVEVPNCSSNQFESSFDTESHLQFFSRRSLMKTLDGLGVQVLNCVSCGPPMPPGVHQGPVLVTSNIGKRISDLAKVRLKNIVEKIWSGEKQVRTIYDGFYEHYPEKDNGLWLRCLGRIQTG